MASQDACKRSYSERRAAELLEQKLGGRAEWKDVPGAAQGTYDFAIRLPTGDLIAVEVTQVTDQDLERVWDPKRDNPWRAPTLKNYWQLHVERWWNHKNRQKVEPLLRTLEELGVMHFATGSDTPQHFSRQAQPTVTELEDLGVTAGKARSCTGGCIEIFTISITTADPRRLPKGIAEYAAHKDDNRKKLRDAKDAKERHLVVWVRPLLGLHSAMWIACEDVANLDPASLPSEIDVVWVALESEPSVGMGVCLLKQSREGRWQKA